MHHYGEDGVETSMSDSGFAIIIKNHKTGAKITITGPTEGVFEDGKRKIRPDEVEKLGHGMAHGIRQILV
jgi:hypothetical protein